MSSPHENSFFIGVNPQNIGSGMAAIVEKTLNCAIVRVLQSAQGVKVSEGAKTVDILPGVRA
jgi:hypothetical protein